MKNRVFVLLGLLAVSLVSCDKNDDNYLPDTKIVTAFTEQYAGAQYVEWEQEGLYQKAEFQLSGTDMEAWYSQTGEWLMTESDITYAALPEAVRTTFESGEYKTWMKDDVDKIERADRETVVYVLEVELGEQEKELYYEEDGTLIKALNGNNQPDHSPDEVI